jgi:mono/diheme cytochrome c family protein
MKMRILFAALAAVLVAVATALPAAEPEPATVSAITIAMPPGDPAAGREVFLELSCTTCHAVAGEDFPAPVAHHAGPELAAAVGGLSAGRIASSIVAPSHQVPPETLEMMEGDLSPMGDFTEAMTVRQLIDLVAYLESLPG